MRKVVTFVALALCVVSCEKNNLLKDVEPGVNVFENPTEPYIIVTKTELSSNCSRLYIWYKANKEAIPDDVVWHRYRIRDSRGKAVTTRTRSRYPIVVKCDEPTTYTISLYNTQLESESAPTTFVHNP